MLFPLASRLSNTLILGKGLRNLKMLLRSRVSIENVCFYCHSYHVVLFSWHVIIFTAKFGPRCCTGVLPVAKLTHSDFKRSQKSESRCCWLQRLFPVEVLHSFDAPICVALRQVISDSKRCDIRSSLVLHAGQPCINHCCQVQIQPVTRRLPVSQSSLMSGWGRCVPASEHGPTPPKPVESHTS